MKVSELLAALIAAVASLGGVAVGLFSSRAAERRQDRLLERTQQREDAIDRRRLAGLIADQFVRTIRSLRGLDEQYFEEMVEEIFLPKQWYEKDEPELLRLLGDVESADVRRGLTDIVTSVSDRSTQGGRPSLYHSVESQLLLGLQIANAYGRGEPLDAEMTHQLLKLQRPADEAGA